MSSSPRGRELVFCHGCSNEWYKEQHGLTCPACEGTFTEIIDDHNDPRADQAPPQSQHPFADHNPWSNVPDPDEDDIDYIHHPRAPQQTAPPLFQALGSLFNNLTQQPQRTSPAPLNMPPPTFPRFDQADRQDPNRSRTGPGSRQTSGPDPNRPHIHIYSNSGPGYSFTARSSTMQFGSDDEHGRAMPMNDISAYAYPTPSVRHNPNDHFPPPFYHHHDRRLFGRPHIHFTHTYEDDPVYGLHNYNRNVDPHTRLMNQIFTQLQQGGAPGSQPGGMPPAFSTFMNSVMRPGGMQFGDFASSDEAFNTILSNLHANQEVGSTAPRPASEAAINALPIVEATPEILGLQAPKSPTKSSRRDSKDGKKADEPPVSEACRTCLEDVFVGTKVAVLPCRHWYHFDCIRLWLIEHDMCPTCRKGIVKKGNDPDRLRKYDEEAQNMPQSAETAPSPPPMQVPESPTAARRGGAGSAGGGGGAAAGSHRRRHDGGSGSSGSPGIGERVRGWMGGSGGSGRRQ